MSYADIVAVPRVARALEVSDDIDAFECREEELLRFLQEDARRFQASGLGQTYVLTKAPEDPADFPQLLGYYTLAMARVSATELPKLHRDSDDFARPAALLARLARDKRVPRDLRLGELLMQDMFERVIAVADIIGCSMVTLDAMNPGLVTYYTQYGFFPLGKERFPQKMGIFVATVRQSFGPDANRNPTSSGD